MMKYAVLAALLGGFAGQATAQTEPLAGNYWNQGGVVYVSCWRGPWVGVIWDRPEAIFIESLVTVGYDYPSALAIATRICRDSTLVGDSAGLKAEMERIIRDAPRP